MRTITVILASVVAVVAIAGAVFWLVPGSPRTETEQVSGEALIGGPFELVDHQGRRVSDEEFAGRWMLVYFGYTYCPDVCPIGLSVMTAAYDTLPESQRANAQPVFITVDPERDTVEAMADYVTLFHDDLIGLTGSTEEVAAAAKAYRVYYRKAESEETTDYLVDHSTFTYVMDEAGRYVTHFAHGTTPEEMAKRLGELIPRG